MNNQITLDVKEVGPWGIITMKNGEEYSQESGAHELGRLTGCNKGNNKIYEIVDIEYKNDESDEPVKFVVIPQE